MLADALEIAHDCLSRRQRDRVVRVGRLKLAYGSLLRRTRTAPRDRSDYGGKTDQASRPQDHRCIRAASSAQAQARRCQAQADSSLVSSRTTHRMISSAAVGRKPLVSAAVYETSFISIVLMLREMSLRSEAIRPMAAPVLRGLPAADEVSDFFLSVLYFAVSKKTTGEDSARDPFSESSLDPPRNSERQEVECLCFGSRSSRCRARYLDTARRCAGSSSDSDGLAFRCFNGDLRCRKANRSRPSTTISRNSEVATPINACQVSGVMVVISS